MVNNLLKVVDHYKPIPVRRCFMKLPKLLLKESAIALLLTVSPLLNTFVGCCFSLRSYQASNFCELIG